jgi:hypothetical protein
MHRESLRVFGTFEYHVRAVGEHERHGGGLAAANWSAQQLLEMLMKPSVLAVNFGLRNLELLLRQLEFLLAIVGFLSLLLERRAHERGEPEQVEK